MNKRLRYGALGLVAVLTMALGSGSYADPLPVRFLATTAGYAPPVVKMAPGETVKWMSLDTHHVLITAASICNNGAVVPVSCNIPGAPGTLAPLPIHPDAVPGRYVFTCSLHSSMVGVIVIEAPAET